ncbi:MAG: hypothetical protein OXI33_00840 [Chloroflexota bacterium]|nr:hypothetical protein [Chloroflexota bacterium]
MSRSTLRWNSSRNRTLSPLTVAAGPDHVGVTSLVCPFADEPGGFLTQRREVDLGRPLRRVAADEDLGHAAVGEDGLEEGVVHGVSGLVGTPRCPGDAGDGIAGWANLRSRAQGRRGGECHTTGLCY